MAIRFIYGRAGTGKSTFCLNQIKKKIENDKNNKLILLVPEQYTFDTEKKFLETVTEKGFLRGEVISFKRMASVVFEECGGRSNVRMNDSGKNMLIYKILKENMNNLKYFNRVAKQQGFSHIIGEMITEFKKYNISTEILDLKEEEIKEEDLKNKIDDLKLLYKIFDESINSKYIDSDDDLTYLAKKLVECDIYDGAEIWLDEFTTFTPQQLEVIKILAKKAKTVNITLCSDTIGIDRDLDYTSVFDAIKNTEYSILRMMEESNISYMEPINLNKEIPYRFRDKEDLRHLERNFFSYPFKTYKGKEKSLRLYKANNSYDEIEVIARDILKRVRDDGYRFRDIAVICRNIENYEKIATVILKEYDIPFFIDKKREILNNPLVIVIVSALEIISSNWSYESVFKYLKSGLLNLEKDYIDRLENYVLANGIKGYKWTRDLYEGVDLETLSKEDNEMIEVMEEIREPILKLQKSLKSKNKVKDLATKLYELLLELDVFKILDKWIENFNELGLQDMIKEYDQVPKMVMDILDQLVEVLGDEDIELKDFIKLITAGFEEKEIGVIPMAIDQVNIGDISRVKGREVKVVYLIGVNDGVLPSVNKEEGIISDRERNILKDIGIKLAADSKTKAYEEQFMVYTALTIASEKLMISYPMADFEGKALRPSIIIPRIKKIFPKVVEESEIFNVEDKNDKFEKITAPTPTFNELIVALRQEIEKETIDEYWAEAYKWFEEDEEFKDKSKVIFKGLTYSNLVDNVPKEKIKNLYKTNDKLIFNVSRLEKYAQCPFSYYVEYGLKAKNRKVYEFTAPDLGSFMHDILEGFTNKVKNEKISWSDLNREKCTYIVNELVDRKLENDKNSILNSNKKYKYFADRFKRTITKSVMVLSEQMRRGQFEIFKNEFAFGGFKDGEAIKIDLPEAKETVYLVGRVDRIDTLDLDGNTYIKVIDYKSGAKKFSLSDVYHGIQIQLLVYLDALIKNSEYILEKQAMPGAILYFKIDDPIIKSNKELDEDEIKKSILKELKMSGLLIKDISVVKAMDNDIDTYSLVIPAGLKKDGDFSSKSSVVTKEQFDILRKYVNEKMISLCEEMLSGEIKLEPTKNKDNAFCTYCDYSSICQFDTGIDNNKYKIILKKKDEKAWNLIKEVVDEKEEERGEE